SSKFRSMICALPVTVEPFQFSPAEPVAYELSKKENFRTIRPKSSILSVTTDIWVSSDFTTRQ
ncbi:MAG: hypothetical protein AB1Z31_14240, partial [Desulfobacterales bacterium]